MPGCLFAVLSRVSFFLNPLIRRFGLQRRLEEFVKGADRQE
jgi:hypothetical protein